ncbi:glucose-1-phosphate adenylyltransferase family protein [Serinicoccus kebangsaanensis]|uniref:glucose-1-phosphate adenylyltransferase family protein n=1 Tax=Serinicoccus kebangsaanensis TaxID=2602069 RepID=UPI00124E6293|nr:sugar phosphate nucleotidyltransferase [Serinicoccus kebangsaanensis]
MTTLPADLRVLAVVQAGGRGSRMDVLTRERAKPALPFAASHALVDFPLSALAAAGVSDVWVSVQFQSSSLDSYLAGGRPWDLDRTRGGFRRVTPEEGSGTAHEDGFSHGNADGLFRMREAIRLEQPDVLLVLSADHIFSLDLRSVTAEHLAREAECTLVTAQIGRQEARHKMVVAQDGHGRVTEVWNKPSRPRSGTVATEIFLYRPDVLLDELDHLRRELSRTGEDSHDTGLGDFADHLVPALVRRGRVYAAPMTGYWKDVGRPQAYLQAHRDLLAGKVDVFDHPDRPVLGPALPGVPGWVGDGGELVDAMVGPGSRVRGRVVRSVLGPDVEVQRGAVVEDSVLLSGVVVEAHATVRSAVVDRGVWVGRGAVVGAAPPGTRVTDAAIALIGQDSRVGRGTTVPPGARLEPGSTT